MRESHIVRVQRVLIFILSPPQPRQPKHKRRGSWHIAVPWHLQCNCCRVKTEVRKRHVLWYKIQTAKRRQTRLLVRASIRAQEKIVLRERHWILDYTIFLMKMYNLGQKKENLFESLRSATGGKWRPGRQQQLLEKLIIICFLFCLQTNLEPKLV